MQRKVQDVEDIAIESASFCSSPRDADLHGSLTGTDVFNDGRYISPLDFWSL